MTRKYYNFYSFINMYIFIFLQSIIFVFNIRIFYYFNRECFMLFFFILDDKSLIMTGHKRIVSLYTVINHVHYNMIFHIFVLEI